MINECENITSTSYYETEFLPSGTWNDSDLTFSKFVQSAIGQLYPNKSLPSKTCKRIAPANTELASPVYKRSVGDSCHTLQNDINGFLENG